MTIGRRPLYPYDPVDPVKLLFQRSESIPLFCRTSTFDIYKNSPSQSFFVDQAGGRADTPGPDLTIYELGR
jgi:hypothetical protein